MINLLFVYTLLLVVFVFYIIRYLEKKNKIKESMEKMKEMQQKYIESIKKGKLEELDKFMAEISDIYRKVMKHTFMITIVGLSALIVVAFLFNIGYSIEVSGNITKINIYNPILYNQDFAIYYNNTFIGFYHAEYDKIILYSPYDPTKLSVNPITIVLPFYLPIININWLNPLLTYIFIYLILQISFAISRKIYKKNLE
ncbi:MAG: hypothetical protein ACP5G1_04210 [Nanopusillaceae archaeon]